MQIKGEKGIKIYLNKNMMMIITAEEWNATGKLKRRLHSAARKRVIK